MRRKSERNTTKATKPKSPEKKVEKLKRGRSKRRKQSESSENESVQESSPVHEEVTSETEKKPPQTPVKEDSPEEAHDQVWHVKAAKQSSDTGEIQKLKLCLTRPPSTPERPDRSPRSKRKHTRATSSTESPSVETVEDKKKSKHRSKRSTRESKDETEKTDSQGDEAEIKTEVLEQQVNEITQATEIAEADETPMSTTDDESKTNITLTEVTESQEGNEKLNVIREAQIKSSHVDTTVASPKAEESDKQLVNTSKQDSPLHTSSESVDKSETQKEMDDKVKTQQNADTKGISTNEEKEEASSSDKEVSKTEDQTDISVTEEAEISQSNKITDNNKTDVLENTDSQKRIDSTDSSRDVEDSNEKNETGLKHLDTTKSSQDTSNENYKNKQLDRSDSTQSTQEDTIHNGQAPIVINRKRRWGSRLSKGNSQKSITISTDILKEIIPDVKPAEFDEVIEEKKHKRVEVTEKVERPVLPKIVIDNTEHVEQNRREHEHTDKENLKTRETNLASNRRISIVKDNDNIIARPPSPPRHKQSCILYITNLVRPFTLPQLKNLLQRTGRIVEDGFWIDKIKSKCYVKYETEDQAVETRHALHGVTWPVPNSKMLQVDFSSQEAFDKAKANEETDNAQVSTIPGTVEDWLREQDLKRERGELERPWERKTSIREWDMGKNEKDKEKLRRNERSLDKRRHHTPEKSPEPAKKFKKKEEEAPAKLLDDLFRKSKTTPCIYWLPLSAETIAIKEEQRRKHMAEHERRMQELRRTHRRH